MFIMQLQARGPKPITSFIKASLGDDILTQSGYVKVRPTLQLQLHPNIFAVGDIIDWDEQKQAAKAFNHAAVAAKNIVSLTLGQDPSMSYSGSVELIMITLGKVGFHCCFFVSLIADQIRRSGGTGTSESCGDFRFPTGSPHGINQAVCILRWSGRSYMFRHISMTSLPEATACALRTRGPRKNHCLVVAHEDLYI